MASFLKLCHGSGLKGSLGQSVPGILPRGPTIVEGPLTSFRQRQLRAAYIDGI